ncbi:methyl-accepting chemotaxis protein [Candidatus Reidiella endopervernicosa]|nr:methyl-accepting chemotaxis protein [Candidatus Reidiella endopervernicosa]QKQ25969.1 methyl-accepting chemotaxis protein [Candidatus Reidiella endopervernicosa]
MANLTFPSLSIRQVVTGGPIVLLLVTSLVLGFARYQNDYDTAVEHSLELSRVGLQPILNLMKASVGGGNYANVQDKEALSLYQADESLMLFVVEGKTDQNGEAFGISYDSGQSAILRTAYPDNYEAGLVKKVDSARNKLKQMAADHPKRGRIEKLANRFKGDLEQYQRGQQQLSDVMSNYRRPDESQFTSGYYLDPKSWRLHMLLDTGNEGGGTIWVVKDASHIGGLWKAILVNVAPLSIGALLIAAFLAWLLARRIHRAINAIKATIVDVEQSSDLTQQIVHQNSDELGEIADTFNNLLVKFRSGISGVATATSTLSGAAEEMSMVAAETNQGLVRQKSDTEEVAHSISIMTSTIGEIASHAADASDATQRTDDEARQGQQVVSETINSIDRLATEIGTASEVITRLGKRSEEIGAVLDVIKGIAEQTNLLALNAAIEAARAGEQGRGFAVVADEVRTLASRTQSSAEEINGMIESLQVNAKEAVTVMENGREQVQQSVDQAAHAGEALQSITTMVDTIREMNERIASAATQQSETSEEVSRTISAISHEVEQTVDRANTTAISSDNLAQLADEMQRLVGQFKI